MMVDIRINLAKCRQTGWNTPESRPTRRRFDPEALATLMVEYQ